MTHFFSKIHPASLWKELNMLLALSKQRWRGSLDCVSCRKAALSWQQSKSNFMPANNAALSIFYCPLWAEKQKVKQCGKSCESVLMEWIRDLHHKNVMPWWFQWWLNGTGIMPEFEAFCRPTDESILFWISVSCWSVNVKHTLLNRQHSRQQPIRVHAPKLWQ